MRSNHVSAEIEKGGPGRLVYSQDMQIGTRAFCGEWNLCSRPKVRYLFPTRDDWSDGRRHFVSPDL